MQSSPTQRLLIRSMIHPKPSDKNFPEQKNEICYNHVKKITVSVKNLRHILDRHKNKQSEYL